jgi:hypothetical protein
VELCTHELHGLLEFQVPAHQTALQVHSPARTLQNDNSQLVQLWSFIQKPCLNPSCTVSPFPLQSNLHAWFFALFGCGLHLWLTSSSVHIFFGRWDSMSHDCPSLLFSLQSRVDLSHFFSSLFGHWIIVCFFLFVHNGHRVTYVFITKFYRGSLLITANFFVFAPCARVWIGWPHPI